MILCRYSIFILFAYAASGCSSFGYYMQAIGGHLDLMSREQPIDEIIANKTYDEQIRDKLTIALKARVFASQNLYLPENDSYKWYADLNRPFVVWNVVATEEFSVKPNTWCFLIVGCVNYRGYFSKEAALKYAEELKSEGYDVAVSGAWAYSTLGYFDDPLLNTMIKKDDARMIGVIFHELAHQKVYIDNDSAFNEAFATAVEQEGLRRWFEGRNEPEKYTAYIQDMKSRTEVYALMRQTRSELEQIYAEDQPAGIKREQKQQAFDRLKKKYRSWQINSEYHGFDTWMQMEINNAHLSLIATYNDLVPGFSGLLRSVNGDLNRFYQEVVHLGKMDKNERWAQLKSYTENYSSDLVLK